MDDCSWVISFTSGRDFQETASELLNQLHDKVLKNGFQIDEDKTEVAWIFASERPKASSRLKAAEWKLEWRGIIRKFDIKTKPTRWLGFFIELAGAYQAVPGSWPPSPTHCPESYDREQSS